MSVFKIAEIVENILNFVSYVELCKLQRINLLFFECCSIVCNRLKKLVNQEEPIEKIWFSNNQKLLQTESHNLKVNHTSGIIDQKKGLYYYIAEKSLSFYFVVESVLGNHNLVLIPNKQKAKLTIAYHFIEENSIVLMHTWICNQPNRSEKNYIIDLSDLAKLSCNEISQSNFEQIMKMTAPDVARVCFNCGGSLFDINKKYCQPIKQQLMINGIPVVLEAYFDHDIKVDAKGFQIISNGLKKSLSYAISFNQQGNQIFLNQFKFKKNSWFAVGYKDNIIEFVPMVSKDEIGPRWFVKCFLTETFLFFDKYNHCLFNVAGVQKLDIMYST
jgi:hypothetical protein